MAHLTRININKNSNTGTKSISRLLHLSKFPSCKENFCVLVCRNAYRASYTKYFE